VPFDRAELFDSLLRQLQRRLGLSLCRVVSRPLRAGPQPQAGQGGIRYARMSELEMLEHCADAQLELTQRQVRDAFARGDVCIGALDGRRLAGYEWLGFGPTPHLNAIWVDFSAQARYGYKKFVRPEYRGQRIAAGLSSHGDELCMRRGRNRTIGFIALDNRASRRASARLGGRTVGYAGYLQWLGVVLPFRSPGAVRAGFRFYVPSSGTGNAWKRGGGLHARSAGNQVS
jgi:GNAT superfamily N-acetyltransferase